IGHSPDNLGEADTLVISSGFRKDNSELVEAQRRGLRILHRSGALASLMVDRRAAAAAGTHHKTTNTAVTTVGGEASPLCDPAIGIVTNVGGDRLDHYGTPEKVREAFSEFCDGIQTRGGTIIACADDPGSHDVALHSRSQGADVVLYGTSEVAVAHSLGADLERAATGLAGYGGTRRRFEERGIAAGVRVIDDYAHHPTEVRAVLSAARGVVTDGGRVWAVFQPHLYSRTMEFREEFGLADEVVVLDVFPAREDPVPGVTGALIADRVPHENVTFLESFAEAVPFVAARVKPGDLVLTVGAGDVTILGPELLSALEG
ncbi:UDP-N-acetylmuramate--L-alanine ligase, partial [Brevibacterium aurantiacum]|uniref:UDP-N-acetylmuramate--L-alanine ligase n=1 Tax=Brevibacterium aurantiacum TaxID=273384 RepID=UPI000C75F2E6